MIKLIFFIFVVLSAFSCDTVAPKEETKVVRENDNIFIVDRTNKKWDVTHAVTNYNFNAETFKHGLGPFAIKPINDPQMTSLGEAGYPGSNETMLVIGANILNDIRAYPLNVLTSHEMVNETIAGHKVGVGY